MTSTEIWLRLMHIGELWGDRVLDIAGSLTRYGVLATAGLTVKQQARFQSIAESNIDASLRWLEEPDQHLLLANSPLYPPALRAIRDYPAALFIKGNIHVLNTPQLAVVGSRAHSFYGEQWGSLFCETLAAAGLTITSGLALGIDGVAHRGALRAQGKTVAVLGSGLYDIYPRRHRSLAMQIVEAGGVLVSEFPLGAQPLPANFPRRNRIISGLSLGVLIVEAALKSGSLVTARCALEQGREVFALPGALGNPGSEGPHWLIQQGAMAVTSPADIVANLQYELHSPPDVVKNTIYSSQQEPTALPFPELLANVGDEVTPVDVVAERAGQPVPVTVAQLLELELAGWIAAVPGGYVRLRRACHVRRTDVFV